jgi:hemerythrin-like metal-binding protein
MALLTWDDSLSVKISSIDEEHQKLFNLINDFYAGLSNNSNAQSLKILIKGMKDYTLTHFRNEETFMKLYNYPKLNTHMAEHADFIAKVTTLEEKLNSGKLIVSFEVTNFLKDWIKNHIKKTDIRYSDFLIQKGVV